MAKNCFNPNLYHIVALLILALITILCLALVGKVTLFNLEKHAQAINCTQKQ
jgi:hypothetical protein